ncbi:alpha/beta hydrolase [Kineosporia sp. NBRC 101731]|uniref:alpha/beta hydrolase n=1 Tax=Kineosporia sp. NBRC 101731 TaxID=3032199 RepID=UPI0024A47BE3|nr:alpha/beta hydrolase [Kineosporia sp. NBRC 101731]GLY28870.1 alpha/beta hydrolase [Kineosporia sp. NBRC 101731]
MTSTRVPVVFIHGLWLHASSWQAWAERFAGQGYEPVFPGWPNEPATVEEARANPEAVAGIGIDDVTEHYTKIIQALPSAPVLVGHSFGGLFVQKLLGQGLGRAGVAIDPAQIKGVKALPLAQLRSGSPVLGNPANRRRSVALTKAQFRYGFGNAISEGESDELFERWTIPSPGRPLFEAAFANFSRHSAAAVNTANPDRGPLLFISGQQDHTVPDVVTRGAFRQYASSPAVTELRQFADRGHSLALDQGWGEIADASLTWLAGKVDVTAA